MRPVPGHQLDILARMVVPGSGESAEIAALDDSFALILDGLIGYSLKGPPSDPIGELVQWTNATAAPVLALDAPLGVDTATGTVFESAVRKPRP